MRILAVTNMWPTPEFPQSGAHVAQAIQGLRDYGVDVEVLLFDRRKQGMRVYWNVSQVIRSKLAESQFDVVHVTYGGVMAERVVRAVRDIPTVVSFCGSDLLGENLAGLLRRVISRQGVLGSHRAACLATAVIVKSANLERTLPSDIEREKVQIIPNGVDLRKFKPLDQQTCQQQLGWSHDRFHILFPANNGSAVKRPELAQAAVNELNSSSALAELHFLKGIVHDEVPIWLNASDVLLLTSAHEGSPNIVKEALACNRPVVAVDVGDVSERLAGIDGCFLAMDTPDDLATKLRLVSRGPGKVEARGHASEVSIEAVSRRLHKCYSAAIEQFDCQRNATITRSAPCTM